MLPKKLDAFWFSHKKIHGAQEAAAHFTLGRAGEAEQCHGGPGRYPHAMVILLPNAMRNFMIFSVQVFRQLQVELLR